MFISWFKRQSLTFMILKHRFNPFRVEQEKRGDFKELLEDNAKQSSRQAYLEQ